MVELVDALMAPAGEYAMRARHALESLVRRVIAAERFGSEPTQPRGKLPPPPPPIGRKPQETMELNISDFVWE